MVTEKEMWKFGTIDGCGMQRSSSEQIMGIRQDPGLLKARLSQRSCFENRLIPSHGVTTGRSSGTRKVWPDKPEVGEKRRGKGKTTRSGEAEEVGEESVQEGPANEAAGKSQRGVVRRQFHRTTGTEGAWRVRRWQRPRQKCRQGEAGSEANRSRDTRSNQAVGKLTSPRSYMRPLPLVAPGRTTHTPLAHVEQGDTRRLRRAPPTTSAILPPLTTSRWAPFQ
jgi:hypothetical protein